jgi:hypothetical protein
MMFVSVKTTKLLVAHYFRFKRPFAELHGAVWALTNEKLIGDHCGWARGVGDDGRPTGGDGDGKGALPPSILSRSPGMNVAGMERVAAPPRAARSKVCGCRALCSAKGRVGGVVWRGEGE